MEPNDDTTQDPNPPKDPTAEPLPERELNPEALVGYEEPREMGGGFL